MPGHFEHAARHNGGFIFFAKQLEESFGIAASKPEREAGKNHGAGRRMKAFDVAARIEEGVEQGAIGGEERASAFAKLLKMVEGHQGKALGDRKSTRLNSSHVAISYAVFCLKKKKKTST